MTLLDLLAVFFLLSYVAFVLCIFSMSERTIVEDLKVFSYITYSIIIVIAILFSFPAKAQSIETYIHPRAVPLLPIIDREAAIYAPKLKQPWVIPAIFDHETCPGYKSYKCWNTSAELRTSREHGLGLPQMTRAWDSKGNLRFDNIKNLREKYPNSLGELDWNTYSRRTDLQIRSAIILFYEEYQNLYMVTDDDQRLRMSRSAYNGGGSRVRTARSKCKLTKSCDSQIWFNNVELHLPQSRTPIKMYGNKSPYQINTAYVRDTEKRLGKFKPYFSRAF